MKETRPVFSDDSQQMLDALRLAVARALDVKRRLGHYAVLWKDGRPVLVGPDAPVQSVAQQATEKSARYEQS